MKNGKRNFGFSYTYIKYAKFWSVLLDHFVEHKALKLDGVRSFYRLQRLIKFGFWNKIYNYHHVVLPKSTSSCVIKISNSYTTLNISFSGPPQMRRPFLILFSYPYVNVMHLYHIYKWRNSLFSGICLAIREISHFPLFSQLYLESGLEKTYLQFSTLFVATGRPSSSL